MNPHDAIPQIPSVPEVSIPTKRRRQNNKKSLGIPEEYIVTWIPFGVPEEISKQLDAIANVWGKRKANMLCDWLKEVMEAKLNDPVIKNAISNMETLSTVKRYGRRGSGVVAVGRHKINEGNEAKRVEISNRIEKTKSAAMGFLERFKSGGQNPPQIPIPIPQSPPPSPRIPQVPPTVPPIPPIPPVKGDV